MQRRPISFERIARFPGVVFLDPDQPSYFSNAIDALMKRWPSWPPYGGAHDEVIPHVTVTLGLSESELDDIESHLQPSLPLDVVAEEAWLISFDGSSWSRDMVVPFAEA